MSNARNFTGGKCHRIIRSERQYLVCWELTAPPYGDLSCPLESALDAAGKVFPLIDSAPAQVHTVSSVEAHRGLSEHAALDAIDHKAFMMMESTEWSHNKALEVKASVME